MRQQERKVDWAAEEQEGGDWEQDEDWNWDEEKEEQKQEVEEDTEEDTEEEGLLEQIVGVGNQTWDHFSAAEGSLSGADPRQGWAQRQPSWLRCIFASGISGGRYRRLLLLLGYAEQSVVATHSLLLRLGGPAAAAAQQQQRQLGSGGSSSSVSDFAATTANALVASALGESLRQQLDKPAAAVAAPAAPAAVASLPATFRAAAEALVVQRWAGEEAASDSASSSGRNAEGDNPGEWPAPFLREWLLQVHSSPAVAAQEQRRGGAESPAMQPEEEPGVGAAGVCCNAVLQRMYVKALPLEVRIATVLSAEPCSQA